MFAGSVTDIAPHSGQWAFVDVGFSREGKTGALLIDREAPSVFSFTELKQRLVALATQRGAALNLVLEAPLSVAFTALGNPAGRSMEKNQDGHRYWYAGLGCQVTTAAAYLLRALHEASRARSVRLFEAFVSFKAASKRSSHCGDVLAMRSVVWQESGHDGYVLSPEALLGPHATRIQSAFTVYGFDLGVPPVIVASAV